MVKPKKLQDSMALPVVRAAFLSNCYVCQQMIRPGDHIHDGGRNNRAHKDCVIYALAGKEEELHEEAALHFSL